MPIDPRIYKELVKVIIIAIIQKLLETVGKRRYR